MCGFLCEPGLFAIWSDLTSCVFSTRLRRRRRNTFTALVGRLVSEDEEAASSSSLPLRPPSSTSWPITTSGVDWWYWFNVSGAPPAGSDCGGVSCFSLLEMKLLDILSSLMMDDTYKGRGKYHSKVRYLHPPDPSEVLQVCPSGGSGSEPLLGSQQQLHVPHAPQGVWGSSLIRRSSWT